MSPFVRAALRASTAALALGLAGHAAAAETAAVEEPPMIVVTAARLPTATVPTLRQAERAIDRTAGGADLVDAQEFAGRFAVNLKDTLAFSPGVFAQGRYGEEVRLSIRGSGLGRSFHLRGVALLQDGVPINLADGSGDFQELDPTIFQHIEVFRGANALRFGSSSLGGAINAVTPSGSTLGTPLALRLEGGSFGTLRGAATAGLDGDRFDGVAAITATTSDGFRQQSAQEKLRFNGNLGVRLADDIETRFYVSANKLDQEVPGTITLAEALATPRLAPEINRANDYARDIRSLRLQSKTAAKLGRAQLEVGGFANLKRLTHPIFQVIDQDSTDWGFYARLAGRGEAAGMKLEYTLGSSARFGSIDAKQFLNVAGKRGALTADSDQTATTIDAYGELRAYPLDELALIAGAQFVHGRREVDNRLRPAASDSATYSELSPKLGALWTPRDNVQVYANLARSAEIPTFSELVQQPVVGFVPLNAQKAWTVEIGTRGERGRVAWDLSFYRASLKGELLQYTVNPNIPASTFNAGRTVHQGIEAGVNLTLAEGLFGGGETPDRLVLRQTYQLNDFRFRDDAQYGDNRLPTVPKHLYRAELSYSGDGFTLAPSLEWVPDGAWADYKNSTQSPGYAQFGVRGTIALTTKTEVFVDARNLANKKAVGDIAAVVAATPASAIYYPIEGRSLFVGVRATF